MIINDFHVIGVAIVPSKTNPILVVDPDAVLSQPRALERLQAIPGRSIKVTERVGLV
jgi:hypothetical protein